MNNLEIINKNKKNNVKVIIFDFDGTISTLRYGWEEIMEKMMIEILSTCRNDTSNIKQEIKQYISDSTGIQTIYQMKWLKRKVKEYKPNQKALDCWEYKKTYNNRLKRIVNARIEKIKKKEKLPFNYLIKGSKKFIEKLYQMNYEMMVVSGTDHPDVIRETKILGVNKYFKKISGAPVNQVDDSKKKVINQLINERDLHGSELLIIGDGKVEISLGAKKGAITLGIASNEDKVKGINEWKRIRLIQAGADAISGDFNNIDEIFSWLHIN